MDRDGVDRLLAEARIDGRRYRTALALLCDGDWWTLADLVRQSATSRRGVEALLRALDPERSGDRFRLSPADVETCRALLRARGTFDGVPPGDPLGGSGGAAAEGSAAVAQTADPVGHLLPRYAEVVARMREAVEAAPRGRHELDHVSATPETTVRRALLLGARFWLPGARLLCVGDHDLTSLAVALVHPGVEVAVVDLDDRVLAHIDAQARRLGVAVRTRWADLRLGLPPSLHGGADLALTDPPYTPEGVGLFTARAVEGLRDHDTGRVLLAYGASERTPMLALKVQRALHDLNLVYEAVFPDFNRYFGAEAIGSAADMYILRPTTKTAPAVAARAARFGTAIYTRGPQAVESAGAARESSADALTDDPAFTPDVLVGDWPGQTLPGTPRVRLSPWLAKPYARPVERVAIAVPAGLEAALPRLLLATRAAHVRAFLAAPPPGGIAAPLAPVYRLTVEAGRVDAVRLRPPTDPVDAVTREILDSAHGKVGNTWREALIKARGLTKRQARALIADIAPWAADATPLDLPLHRLTSLPDAVRACLARAAG